MSSQHCMGRLVLRLILLGMVTGAPAFAASAVVGSVAGSMNASVGGQALLPHTTLFSGDSLQVKDGVAVVAFGNASRIVFGRDTVASFLRDSNEVTVLLGQGNVSVFRAGAGMAVRLKIGDVSVAPVSGFKTLGEVTMLDGAIVVAVREGILRVEGNGPAINVAKGKTITVVPKANAPQGGGRAPGGGGRRCCGSKVWGITATVTGAAGVIVGAITVSRADSANDNAKSAASAASAAAAAAAAATSTANCIALTELYNSIAMGCALNNLAGELGEPSPYTPPAGQTCSGGLPHPVCGAAQPVL